MNPQQQAVAEEIALVAAGLRPAKREAYLCRRAAGEPEILAEVRRRLDLAGRIPAGFLDLPAVELLDSEDPAPEPLAREVRRLRPCRKSSGQ